MARLIAKYSLLILLSLSYASHARGQTSTYATDELIIKMKNHRGAREQSFLSKAQSEKGLNLKNSWGRMGLYHFGLKKGQDLGQTMADLRKDPDVEYVEPNYYLNKLDVGGFSDIISESEMVALSGGSYQATSAPIQVTSSWSLITGSHTPVVAVIDTGVDTNHSVFANTNAIWRNPGEMGLDGNGNSKSTNGIDDDGNGYIDDLNGWNFVSGNNNVFDNNGHGTHVAGIIVGVGTNIYVSNPTASPFKIMPLKFLNGSGVGKTSDAIKAIYYAVNNGAQVLNNSWGGYSYSAALHEAITFSYNEGVSFVAAAGNETNDNDSVPVYPASYNVPNVISVAATTDSDNLASFSNFGKNTVGLASPGYRIYSTYPGSAFGLSSGTSMSSPFVAGLAAILVKNEPAMLGYQIRELILDNADPVSGLATKVQTQGRMNVYDTVVAADSASILSSQPSYNFVNQDRGVASAPAGCGTVSTFMQGSSNDQWGPPGTQSWGLFVVIALVLLPIAIATYLKSSRPESRRRFERYKIDSEVKIQLGEKQLVGSISSISLGGVQLNTNALLEQGGIVKMSILGPDGQEIVDVEGRVVWSEAQKAYGVQFQQAQPTVLDKISGWTKLLTKA